MNDIKKEVIPAGKLRVLMNDAFHKIDEDFKHIFFLTPSMSGFNHLDDATDDDWGIGTTTGDFLVDGAGNVLSSIDSIDPCFRIYAEDKALNIWAKFACEYDIEESNDNKD